MMKEGYIVQFKNDPTGVCYEVECFGVGNTVLISTIDDDKYKLFFVDKSALVTYGHKYAPKNHLWYLGIC